MENELKNITLNIEGMTCTNCAKSISRAIEDNKAEKIDVNFATGEARFVLQDDSDIDNIIKSIKRLGYKASKDRVVETENKWSPVEKKFYFTLIFTIPLFSHMFLPFEFLQHPIVQLVICLPVFIVGFMHFGKSAFGSLKTGIPNMDVLIVLGSTAAFVYSLAGTIQFYGTELVHHYLFFETTATIISLVLLGNVLEYRSVKQTTTAIKELSKIQATRAMKVIMTDGEEKFSEVDYKDIEEGDVMIVNTGDKIPVDGELIWGSASIDESMISGESIPVEKMIKDKVIGGAILVKGSLKMKATSVGEDTVLSKIIELVKSAQQNKPAIQRLGDKVSAVFVPVVVAVAFGTFFISHFVFDISLQKALMSSIAVLVISCPCAMGLATPTAVMVGIGRAARRGILIKGGSTIEEFAKIKSIVFDKTGTLTTGEFKVKEIECLNNTDEKTIIDILFNLEQHSSHPIAKSIVKEYRDKASPLVFTEVIEEKGLGIKAKDGEGNSYQVGSYNIVKHLTDPSRPILDESFHSLYVLKNNALIARVNITDEIKSNALKMITSLKSQHINTILLSGDTDKKCKELASQLKIDKVYSERLPHQKLEIIDSLVNEAPTATVGDGINDAPALVKATVGVSLSNATQVAIQSAQIILLKENDLNVVNNALQISKHTLLTIKQNLFWAFFYNIVAIPIAAVGLLNPMVGALAMAFSDVIVIGNSIRLKTKKIN